MGGAGGFNAPAQRGRPPSRSNPSSAPVGTRGLSHCGNDDDDEEGSAERAAVPSGGATDPARLPALKLWLEADGGGGAGASDVGDTRSSCWTGAPAGARVVDDRDQPSAHAWRSSVGSAT